MLKVLLLLCSPFIISVISSVVKRDVNDANQLIDQLLYSITRELRDTGRNVISIPDIYNTFRVKWNFITVSGELTGVGGWLKDLASLRRIGDVEFAQGANYVSLGVTLGLEDLELGFQHYDVTIWNVAVGGDIIASIDDNSIYVHLTVNSDDKGGCETVINELEIKTLSGFNVVLSGISRDFDWLYSKIVQYIVNEYDRKIADAVTIKLYSAIQDALKENDICKHF